MKNKISIFLIILFILMVITACGKSVDSTTIDTIVPSQTPTSTLLSNSTSSATSTDSAIPTSTLIPWETKTPLLPIPTFWYFEATTTPIPTPGLPVDQFTLPKLNIEEYINILRLADNYAHENDLLWIGETRPNFIKNQTSLNLITKEILNFYPESAYTDDLLWKLALTNAVAGNHDSDQWIANKIEEELNKGTFSPQAINDYLNQYGFKVYKQFELENLFGDGLTNSVYIINSNYEWYVGYDGIVAVLRGNEPGSYNFYLAASYWNFDTAMWLQNEDLCPDGTLDLNQNGISEICLFVELGYSFTFPTRFFLLEWQGDSFINLAKDTSSYSTGGYYMGYLELEPKDNPVINLTIVRSETYGDTYNYAFDGTYLELVSAEFRYIYDQVEYYFINSEFSTAIEYLEETINGGPPYFHVGLFLERDTLRDEFTDTLRFWLGMAYAYNSDVEKAREIFLSLANQPTLQEYPIYSETARGFVDLYFDDFDLFTSCNNAEVVNNQYIRNLEPEEIYGYTTTYIDPINLACASQYSTTTAIASVPVDLPSQLPNFLRDAGVDVVKSVSFDALGDNLRDWYLLIKDPTRNAYYRIIAVQYRGHWYTAYYWSEDYNNLPFETITTINLSGIDTPVLVIETREETYLIETIPSDNDITFRSISEVGYDYQLLSNENFTVITSARMEAVYDEETWEEIGEVEVWENLIWNPDTKEFDPYSPIVFEAPELVIELATVNPDTNPTYELALAYELTGKERQAIEIYWQVWAQDPGSAYALIARAKLEEISP